MTRTSTTARERKHARFLIEAFCGQFGEWAPAYRLLARHVALPLILTPDLVSYLRNHFLRGQAPWVAESDLLLSELCREVAYEQYVMDQAVRAVLIEELRRDPTLGKARMAEVARLLIGYIRSLARTDQPLPSHELQAQQWAAMVYLDDKRESAARQIATAFSGVFKPGGAGGVDRTGLARLANLTQTLAPELGTYRELVSYSRNVARLLGDVTGKAVAELGRTWLLDTRVQVLDVELPNLRRVVPLPRVESQMTEGWQPEGSSPNPFQYFGPLDNLSEAVSRARELQQVIIHLQRHGVVSVLAPPQTGKTTFLFQLRNQLRKEARQVVYLDFGNRVYKDLREVEKEIAYSVREQCPGVQLEPQVREPSLIEFLRKLTCPGGLVWLIDELPSAGVAVDFLRSVRGYYSKAWNIESNVSPHGFVFAGSTDLVDLSLSDSPMISPFNIAAELFLADFEEQQVRELIWRNPGQMFSDQAVKLICAYTGGHPFLVQFLCYHLYGLDSAEVDRRLSDLSALLAGVPIEDTINVQKLMYHIFEHPNRRNDCVAILNGILQGERVPFVMSNSAIRYLFFQGCIRNQDGYCAVRNSIYEMLLWKHSEIQKRLPPTRDKSEPARVLNRVDSDTRPPPRTVIGQGKAWAVLVGVNTYDDHQHFRRLDVCVNDAEAIRERLIAGGFGPVRIRLLTDNTDEKPTRASILAALGAIVDATEPDDLLLFYYSGHGDLSAGQSYLVACDSRKEALVESAIPLMRVKEIMGGASARAKVILIDAAHSGYGSVPATAKQTQQLGRQTEGVATLAACGQNQLAWASQEMRHSVFTYFVLEALAGKADLDGKGFVTLIDASHYVTDGVTRWASEHNAQQTPTLEYSVAGDILLVRHVAGAQTSQTRADIGAPPHVVRTEPADGETDVNPVPQKLVITFDRPMTGASWSINASEELDMAGLVPELSNDGTTFMFSFKTPTPLPGNAKITCIINPAEPSGRGFVDTEGRRAETYSLSFTTGVLITSVEPMPNPYGWAAPMEGNRFVDREEILHLLEELWGSSKYQSSVLLYGQRRIGKTSILREFTRRSQTRAIVSYLDIMMAVSSTGEFLYEIAEGLHRALAAVDAGTSKKPRKQDFAKGNPFAAFERFLEQVDRVRGDRQVIIVMDEYEAMWQLIAEARVDAEVLLFWRSLHEAHPWFTFVWAGLHTFQDMERMERNPGMSPLSNIFRIVHVGYMSYEATAQLITRPALDVRLEYSTVAVREIYALTNGHPYLTQLLCGDLVDFINTQARRNIIRSDVNVVVNNSNLFQVGGYYFEGLWQQAIGDAASGQAEVLQAIARSETPMDVSAIAGATRLSADATRRALETLERLDVLLRDGTNRWRYAVELMRRWVARSDS